MLEIIHMGVNRVGIVQIVCCGLAAERDGVKKKTQRKRSCERRREGDRVKHAVHQ